MYLRPRSHGSAIVPLRSKVFRKVDAERLRSDGNASSKAVPFQKVERLKSDSSQKCGTVRKRPVPFPSEQANGKLINGQIAFLSEHNTKLVRNCSVRV